MSASPPPQNPNEGPVPRDAEEMVGEVRASARRWRNIWLLVALTYGWMALMAPTVLAIGPAGQHQLADSGPFMTLIWLTFSLPVVCFFTFLLSLALDGSGIYDLARYCVVLPGLHLLALAAVGAGVMVLGPGWDFGVLFTLAPFAAVGLGALIFRGKKQAAPKT
jgi:hypothetical protein